MDKDLNQLVEKLKAAAEANLKSVVVYGSAATGEFHPQHSNINLLCVVERAGAVELKKLNDVAVWWTRKGHPAPLVFSLEELRRSADVFAIELLDIQAGRRVLFGEDVFAGLEVPMRLHAVQLEHELCGRLIRLRQRYLVAQDAKSLLPLMTASISTFLALFRHVLIAFGQEAPTAKREIVARAAAFLGFDATPFSTILEVREGKRGEKQVEVEAVFRAYLEAISLVVDEVDRRLSA